MPNAEATPKLTVIILERGNWGSSHYRSDGVHVAGRRDISKTHLGYDPACSCCWVGMSHSEDLHAASGGKRT